MTKAEMKPNDPTLAILADIAGADAYVENCQRIVPKGWQQYADDWYRGYDAAKEADKNDKK